MSDQGSSLVAKFGIGVILVLIAVNLFSGLVAKKVGIPGVFEIEFGSKENPQPTQAPATPQPSMQPVAPLPLPQATLVVDQLHRGDYTTITKAVKAARPGMRIIVRPGLYEEGLVIDKPLEIIGDGEVGEVVIRAVGKNVVLFKTNMGRISNLALRQEGGGEWFGVDITQGRLELEGCDISSQSLACVAIHGGADPRLRRNRIHDGKAGGVFVYENGQGLLEDNDIFGNAFAGVEIRTGGNPTVRKNRINRNADQAVYIHEKGHGMIEDNDLRDNAKGAWLIPSDNKGNVKRARNVE
ncbi:MAG: right-handed parallel beta-helix repeat-containing protein [Blastocatellia bacterium]